MKKKVPINIVQVVVPPSPLNNSKCKNFNELQKIQELLVSMVIIITKLSVNHRFVFSNSLTLQERYKQSMRNEAIPELFFHLESDTLYSGIQKKLSNKVPSEVQE